MMQSKSFKLLSIIVMTLILMILVSGCGKSGSRFANLPPTIKITSFEGWDNSYVDAGYDTTATYSFQQRIYWNATDPDGVIAGFAFRILDKNGNPVATPGYHYIDTAAELTPSNLLPIGTGWVIHYLPGADQSIPLDDSGARRSIWTSQKYAVINFPSADAQGNPITNYSKFEVVAIDNRGAVTSQPAWRNFKTTSARPKCTISTTKGNPDGKMVGAGMKLQFSMQDFDPFIPHLPYKYEFQIMKTDTLGVVIPGTQTEWFSTTEADNETGKINEYLLTRYTHPPLEYDYDTQTGAYLNRLTRISARVTDMAGVVSIPDTNTVIEFKVKPGFKPKTVIYPTKTYALGNHHYEDYGDDSTEEVLPSTSVQGSVRYATPLFKDTQGRYTAVHSTNMKLWVRWGWWGEYANMAGETAVPTLDPYSKKVDVVLDRISNENYFSEITHFDLRYDGAPYIFPPYPNSNVGPDANGKYWLRVPVNSPLGQTIVLAGGQLPVPANSTPGEHTFEVRVVDLQGEVDPQPSEFKFYLCSYVEPNNRTGVLVIDDDVNQATQAPDEIVDAKYANMLAGYTGTVDVFTRPPDPSQPGVPNPSEDNRGRAIAYSDLQKYRLVIYHNDNSGDPGNLPNDVDAFTLYMLSGGNMVISHTHKMSEVLDNLSKLGSRTTFLHYIGLDGVPNLPYPNKPNPANWYFFQQAISSLSGYGDMNLQFGTPPAFNTIVNTRQGLPYVTYFPGDSFMGDTLYKFGCKPVDYAAFPPTQAQFNALNNQVVAYRKVSSNNSKAYVFGFPLSYMRDADTQAMMNKILSEVM